VECRKRLRCFPQVLKTSISNVVEVEIDALECRKRFQCFMQIIKASISALAAIKKREIEYCILTKTYESKLRLMLWSAGRDFNALLRYFTLLSVMSLQLERSEIE
jgi:hypothetical protein